MFLRAFMLHPYAYIRDIIMRHARVFRRYSTILPRNLVTLQCALNIHEGMSFDFFSEINI